MNFKAFILAKKYKLPFKRRTSQLVEHLVDFSSFAVPISSKSASLYCCEFRTRRPTCRPSSVELCQRSQDRRDPHSKHHPSLKLSPISPKFSRFILFIIIYFVNNACFGGSILLVIIMHTTPGIQPLWL